jgi:hypothetical protein
MRSWSCCVGGSSSFSSEAALLRLVRAHAQRGDVAFDDLLVAGPPAAPALLDVALDRRQVDAGHLRDGADQDDRRRQRVARLARHLVGGEAERPPRLLQFELLGVVDDDAALAQLLDVVVVGVAVLRDQDVQVVARRQDRLAGDASLAPRGSAFDLRGEGGEGEDVVAACAAAEAISSAPPTTPCPPSPAKRTTRLLLIRRPFVAGVAPATGPARHRHGRGTANREPSLGPSLDPVSADELAR